MLDVRLQERPFEGRAVTQLLAACYELAYTRKGGSFRCAGFTPTDDHKANPYTRSRLALRLTPRRSR
jgi:hypothetical protein